MTCVSDSLSSLVNQTNRTTYLTLEIRLAKILYIKYIAIIISGEIKLLLNVGILIN